MEEIHAGLNNVGIVLKPLKDHYDDWPAILKQQSYKSYPSFKYYAHKPRN